MIKPVSLVDVSKRVNTNYTQTNPVNLKTPLIANDTVSFEGRKNKPNTEKIKEINDEAKISAKKAMKRSEELAKLYGSSEITEDHSLLASLEVLDEYIEALDSGNTYYGAEKSSDMSHFLEMAFDAEIFRNEEKREKIKPIIKDEIRVLHNKLENEKTRKVVLKPKYNKDHLDTMYGAWKSEQDDFGEDSPFSDKYLIQAALYSDNDDYIQETALPFRRKLQEALMYDDTSLNERPHLSFYDEKAKNVWKNLAVGTNMFVLHDKNVNPQYLIDSFRHVLNEGGEYGKLNKDNTDISLFNYGASDDFISHKIRRLTKDEARNQVFIIPTKGNLDFSPGLEEKFKKPQENARYVIVCEKDNYYENIDPQDDKNPFADFGEVNVPILNKDNAKQVFAHEKDVLMKKINKPFEPEAIDKVIDVTAGLLGNYPEKAQKIMGLIASYYIDKDIITAQDVQDYVMEAQEVFKPVDTESSVIVSFDTGKKLEDLVGSKGTAQEAQSIIRRIKNGSIGTKGYIIYSQDGYPGAGRRHTAQVIAGEAKVPYVEINAMDFGTKDIDLFGAGNLTPEASMKKLFGLIKSQAETNESKSAVLFIENFEYFSVGEQVSEYHQKAMSQLLREMSNAEKQGLNIVIMGSMSNPNLVGESTMKSFKFIDKIEVESPSKNLKAREEILRYYIDKKNIKIDGETQEDKDKIIRSAAETTRGFPLVELIAYLDKAQNIANERERDLVKKEDFIESYLQIRTGRPSFIDFPEHSKEITCSHECGHAINMEIMSEILNENGAPWQSSEEVNFISLDPRSDYLGAVYPKMPENGEYTLYDVLSAMIVDYGGNSAEKLIYGFDGSIGISQDMENMTVRAQQAIQYLGLGPNIGKMCIYESPFGGLDLSDGMREKFDKDFEVFSKNTGIVSDKIVEAYKPFVEEFAKKYKSKVGTGECLVSSEDFKAELQDWRNRQTPEKQEELRNLNDEIVEIMEKTRKGELVNEN